MFSTSKGSKHFKYNATSYLKHFIIDLFCIFFHAIICTPASCVLFSEVSSYVSTMSSVLCSSNGYEFLEHLLRKKVKKIPFPSEKLNIL